MLRPVLCRPVLRVRCVLHELIEMIIAQKIMLRKQQKRIDPSSKMHRREHVGNIPFFAPYQIHADAAKKQSIFRLLFCCIVSETCPGYAPILCFFFSAFLLPQPAH